MFSSQSPGPAITCSPADYEWYVEIPGVTLTDQQTVDTKFISALDGRVDMRRFFFRTEEDTLIIDPLHLEDFS